MAAGVTVALKSFWTLVNNWKNSKDSELILKSENGGSLQGDISLILTPGQGSREEQCENCGAGMAPDHQCQMTPEKSPDINEE